MLEKIREGSQGIIAKSILGLVILTFALAGVGSYLSTPAEINVAVVNGEKISSADYEQAFQNERARMQQQFGEMYATLSADTAYMNNFRNEVLERLINEELQKQLAAKLNLRVGDEQIRDAIRNMAEFQVEGQFNNDRYIALLRQAGYQPEQFRELIREQMARNQLLSGLLASEFATAKDMQFLTKLQQQSRDIEFVRISAANFVSQVELTEQLVQDYYTTNLSTYETEEKVAVDYIELSSAAIAADISVSADQVAEYYEANKTRYTTEARRQVAHIMLESEQEDAEIAAKAEQLLQRLKAGADFAELAKQESADTFSAENGGILEWLSEGDVDPEFERVAFSMQQVGELSEVVKSAYGYHIVKLVEYQPAVIRSLSEVSAEIEQSLKQEQADTRFYELQQRLAEVSFEVPDTLEDAAAAVDLKVMSTPLFSRSEVTAPLNAPSVVNKVFDRTFIDEGLNSELIELDGQTAIVVRVNQYQPKRVMPLEEVKSDVELAVKAEQSAKLAKSKAEEILTLAQASDFASKVSELDIKIEQALDTPRFGGTLDPQIRAKAFAMARPVAEQLDAQLVELSNGDVAVVRVLAVKDAEVSMEPQAEQLDRLAEQQADNAYRALLEALKADADISRNLKAINTGV